mgnify:CR=1 FL=1
MGLLNREKLLAKEKLEIRKVDMGNGDHVYVRQMTGRERDSFEQLLISVDDAADVASGKKNKIAARSEDFRAKLATHTVCDEKGNLILEPGDYEILSQHMSARSLERIINVAQELNLISDKDKEGLVKNSEAVPSDGDTLGSV